MSTSSRMELAAGQITPSGDVIRVALVKPAGSPPAVLITWPAAPSVTNANLKALASVATSVVCILAEAQARLAARGAAGL